MRESEQKRKFMEEKIEKRGRGESEEKLGRYKRR